MKTFYGIPCIEEVQRIEREPEHDKKTYKAAIDEIVIGPVKSVHLERMDDNCYWMGIYGDDPEARQVITFEARGLIVARTEGE